MAKDTPILPTAAGRKQVVVEEKGWERRNAYLPLPGQEANLGETRTAQPSEIPL